MMAASLFSCFHQDKVYICASVTDFSQCNMLYFSKSYRAVIKNILILLLRAVVISLHNEMQDRFHSVH